MKSSKKAREQIFEIVKNQLEANDPPETKITYDRLKALGYSEFEIKQLIGQAVAIEIFNVLKFGEEFNRERYLKNLEKLPEDLFE